jgi:hypothetical protein
MKTVITALRAVENRVRQAAAKAHAEWQAEADLAEFRRKEWERRAADITARGGTPPPLPEGVAKAPHTPRLTVSDVTIEKLGDILASQPRGCLLIRDELAGFFGTMGRYTAGGGGDRQFWIEAFNGGPFGVERLSRGPVRIENLSIGLLGGIQPDKLASVLMRDADDDGMLARFCPVLPQQVPIAIPTRVPDTAFAERAFERLYGLELTIGADGIAKPEIVRLAEPAKKLMHEHRLWVREVEDETSGLVRSYIGKTPGAVARISLVLAMLEWAAGDTAKPPAVIDAEVFRRASRYVVDYLYPMVRRAYAEASTAPEEKAARALARSLHARRIERITRSKILALKLEGLRNGKAVAAAVALLTDACILLEDRVPTGGRDRLEYLVNPRIWE